jgi:hypothetical protein
MVKFYVRRWYVSERVYGRGVALSVKITLQSFNPTVQRKARSDERATRTLLAWCCFVFGGMPHDTSFRGTLAGTQLPPPFLFMGLQQQTLLAWQVYFR